MAKANDGKSIIGSDNQKRSLPKLNKKAVIILVAILLAGAGLAFFFLRSDKSEDAPKVQATTTCTESSANNVLAEAAPLLDSADQQALRVIVEKIKELPGHDRDPNCLAVIAKYYVNISDATNSSLYAEKLQLVYSPEKGYDATIAANVYSPEELQPITQFLKNDQEQIEKNSFYITTGEER